MSRPGAHVLPSRDKAPKKSGKSLYLLAGREPKHMCMLAPAHRKASSLARNLKVPPIKEDELLGKQGGSWHLLAREAASG